MARLYAELSTRVLRRRQLLTLETTMRIPLSGLRLCLFTITWRGDMKSAHSVSACSSLVRVNYHPSLRS